MNSELGKVGGGARTTGQSSSNTRPGKIRERSFAYALRAIKLYQYLQKQERGAGWIVGKQFLRSACSIGANVEEAQSGESRADFVHKVEIAQKEARESLFWLRLLRDSGLISSGQIELLICESQELIRILTSIILTTK